jgi:hypothetical protein
MTDDPVSCVRAYEQLWRSDVSDQDVDRLLHSSFVAHAPAEQGTGSEEFKGRLRMALGALSEIEARFEPMVASGSRIAAHAAITGTHHQRVLRHRAHW